MRRIWMVAGFVLMIPMVSRAQHRGAVGMPGPVAVAVAPHGVAVSAPHMAVRAPAPTRPTSTVVHRTRAAGTPNRNISVASGLTNLPVFSTDMNVPGLGFDYPHLAAVRPRRGGRDFDRNASFGSGGFLFSSPEVIVENPQAVEEAQASAPEDVAAENGAAAEGARELQRAYPSRTTPAPEPAVDASEYVFVRRDGGLLFAVAYSWGNGTLQYVTRDGVRKTVTQEALDMQATQQFNEQRGLSFRVPA